MKILWRKFLRRFGLGEKLYFDAWGERRVAETARRIGLTTVEVPMSARSWEELRDRLTAIDETRSSFRLGPLFSPELIGRFAGARGR